jgi:hypothetical protein
VDEACVELGRTDRTMMRRIRRDLASDVDLTSTWLKRVHRKVHKERHVQERMSPCFGGSSKRLSFWISGNRK